jgi:Protein of unknown function (DUF3237)
VRLEPLYVVRFSYSGGWGADLTGQDSAEGLFFFLAEGRCESRISGRFRGANHPSRRGDGTFLPDFQGVIETDDGAEVLFDYRGYGRAYPAGRRQIVTSATHLSENERYRWLNDSLSVGVGEVRSQEYGPTELVIEWSEVVWELISD